MITGYYAIGYAVWKSFGDAFFQDSHRYAGISPLFCGVVIVDNISCMGDVNNVPCVIIVNDPLCLGIENGRKALVDQLHLSLILALTLLSILWQMVHIHLRRSTQHTSLYNRVPFISTDVGESNKIIGKYGWAIRSRDPKQLSKSIESAIKVFKKPNLYLKMSTNCNNHIKKNYSNQLMITKFNKLFSKFAI